jgi:hypothetical protein
MWEQAAKDFVERVRSDAAFREKTMAEPDDVVAGWCFDICWTDAASSCPRHFR